MWQSFHATYGLENKRDSATNQFEYSVPISRSQYLPDGHKKIGKGIRSRIDLSDAAEAYSLYRREDCVDVLQITDAMADCAVPEGASWSKITLSLDLTRQSIKFSSERAGNLRGQHCAVTSQLSTESRLSW